MNVKLFDRWNLRKPKRLTFIRELGSHRRRHDQMSRQVARTMGTITVKDDYVQRKELRHNHTCSGTAFPSSAPLKKRLEDVRIDEEEYLAQGRVSLQADRC